MNVKIYKYSLEVKDSQIINVPANSTAISIKSQNEIPVLYALVDEECKDQGQIRIECRGTGHKLDGKEPIEIIETLLFRKGNLVLHFFTHRIPIIIEKEGQS
ncbi:hypothetical protein [Listeria seeligeri]|uniref:DUF7352 domain-containing protein n=1 Tax=Listeria seeligeri TaxID=1640 RepID=UPI0022EBC2BE|nr:hypothetical protein [Listeria seeligeri]